MYGIRLVINGYYRTGTTILGLLFAWSNPHLVYIHEPCSPIIGYELKNYEKGKKHPLHDEDIYYGYYQLGEDVVKYFTEYYTPFDFIKEHEKVIEVLDFLNRKAIENKVQLIVKLNQAHLVLDKIARRYGCTVIHVVRDCAETLFDHVYPEYQNNIDGMLKYLLEKDYNYCYMFGFWFEPLANSIVEKFISFGRQLEYGITRPLEKFLLSYYIVNSLAILQSLVNRNVVIVNFDAFVLNPIKYKEFLEKVTGLILDSKYIAKLSPSKAFKAPKVLKEIVYDAVSSSIRQALNYILPKLFTFVLVNALI